MINKKIQNCHRKFDTSNKNKQNVCETTLSGVCILKKRYPENESRHKYAQYRFVDVRYTPQGK